jgi:hypothetical protein
MSTNTYNEPSRTRSAALETTSVITTGAPHTHRRISWGAIFGGVILVVAVQLLLTLLGAGIGLDQVNTNAGTTPAASNFGIGVAVWWIVSSIIATAFGGYAAAWLAGIDLRWDGLLHGLITWGVATFMTLWLLSSAVGGAIGGASSALGSLASAAGSGLKDAAQTATQAAGITPDMLQQQAQAYLKPADTDPATMSAEDAQKEIVTGLAVYAKGGPDAATAKTRIVAIMAAQQHIPADQAGKEFDDAQAKLKQQKDQAVQAAKNAADATATAASHTSFAAFAALLIGAIAAAIGGSQAVQRRQRVTTRIAG